VAAARRLLEPVRHVQPDDADAHAEVRLVERGPPREVHPRDAEVSAVVPLRGRQGSSVKSRPERVVVHAGGGPSVLHQSKTDASTPPRLRSYSASSSAAWLILYCR